MSGGSVVEVGVWDDVLLGDCLGCFVADGDKVVVEGIGNVCWFCVGDVVVVDCCEGWLWGFLSRYVGLECVPLLFGVVLVLFELFGDVLLK